MALRRSPARPPAGVVERSSERRALPDEMQLWYTPLSPFCRKVRLALDWKRLPYRLACVERAEEVPGLSPGAEVPVLVDGLTVVVRSSDILAYLDRLQPDPPLYPRAAAAYAAVRHWERLADTRLDAIVSVVGTLRRSPAVAVPEGLAREAACEIDAIHAEFDDQLATHQFLCGAPSAADFAAYPQVTAAAALGFTADPAQRPHLRRWLRTMRRRPEGLVDTAAVREEATRRDAPAGGTDRVDWGAHRLEWLLSQGLADWFAAEVSAGRVRWSVGPGRRGSGSA